MRDGYTVTLLLSPARHSDGTGRQLSDAPGARRTGHPRKRGRPDPGLRRYSEVMTSAPASGAAAVAEACSPATDAGECCVPASEAAESAAALDDAALALVAKALGHPARVRIMRLLIERRACVTGDLVAEMTLSQSTVYEHLRILREAGLIQGAIDGPRVSYCVNQAGLAALKQAVAGL